MGVPQRFFFVHLQKTGGTALFQRLRDHFGPAAIYPTPDDLSGVQAVTDVAHVVEWFQARRDQLQLVTGHFPLCLPEVLGEPFTTFTVLRDPVERTLSVLRRRQVAEERFRGLALEEIYEDEPLQVIIRNHMVKMLSLTPDEMTASPLLAQVTFDDARLLAAQDNLEQRVDAFGFQEDLDELCEQLESRFGWDLGAPRFANRTRPGPVSDSLRARIAVDNQMDIELYRFARGLRDARAREA